MRQLAVLPIWHLGRLQHRPRVLQLRQEGAKPAPGVASVLPLLPELLRFPNPSHQVSLLNQHWSRVGGVWFLVFTEGLLSWSKAQCATDQTLHLAARTPATQPQVERFEWSRVSL